MIKKFSLLWPDISNRTYRGKGMKSGYIKDLGVDILISLLTSGTTENHIFYQTLSNLCTDPRVLNYRLDIFDDFMNIKNIDNVIYYVLESIKSRKNTAKSAYKKSTFIKIDELISNINEYLNAVNISYNMLSNVEFKSAGMKNLTSILGETIESPFFKYFSLFGSDLRDANNNPEYIAFKMNLGLPMSYKEANLYDLFTLEKFSKILKINSNENEKPCNLHVNSYIAEDLKEIFISLRDDFYEKLFAYFNEMDKNLSIIEYELSYYLNMSNIFKHLKNVGINSCRPVFTSKDEKSTYIKNGYDPVLTLQLKVNNMTNLLVANDAFFSKESLSSVVTGVNQGGKTTWLRMIGLSHVMAQAGLYVFAEEAVLSPVDNIFTVFASEEKGELGHGKLGEDFIKISNLFDNVTGDSLVLLNEALSSTSQDDAAFLTTEYIKILNKIGCRSALVTHYIKVVHKIKETNAVSDINIRILLSIVEKINGKMMRTYRIEEGYISPDKLLTDLAEREGVSYEQLLDLNQG